MFPGCTTRTCGQCATQKKGPEQVQLKAASQGWRDIRQSADQSGTLPEPMSQKTEGPTRSRLTVQKLTAPSCSAATSSFYQVVGFTCNCLTGRGTIIVVTAVSELLRSAGLHGHVIQYCENVSLENYQSKRCICMYTNCPKVGSPQCFGCSGSEHQSVPATKVTSILNVAMCSAATSTVNTMRTHVVVRFWIVLYAHSLMQFIHGHNQLQ